MGHDLYKPLSKKDQKLVTSIVTRSHEQGIRKHESGNVRESLILHVVTGDSVLAAAAEIIKSTGKVPTVLHLTDRFFTTLLVWYNMKAGRVPKAELGNVHAIKIKDLEIRRDLPNDDRLGFLFEFPVDPPFPEKRE